MPLYPLHAPTNPQGPVVRFSINGVQPPAADYISPSDQLVLEVLSPLLNCTVSLHIRILDLTGNVQVTAQPYTVVANPTVVSRFFTNPSECFLLSANVEVDNAVRGQVFCRLIIQRGQGGAASSDGQTLAQGYVTNSDFLSFPQANLGSSLDGMGHVYSITGNAPVPGAPAVIDVPMGVRWKVKFMKATLDTVTGDISTFPSLQSIDAASNLLWESFITIQDDPPPHTYTLELLDQVVITPFQSIGGLSASAFALAGGTLQLQVASQPSDAFFSALTVTVEEFVEF